MGRIGEPLPDGETDRFWKARRVINLEEFHARTWCLVCLKYGCITAHILNREQWEQVRKRAGG